MTRNLRKALRLLTLQAGVIAIAVASAHAAAEPIPSGAVAAYPHCTRYVPPTEPDTLCGTFGPNPYEPVFAGPYYTSAYAMRDSNWIILPSARDWNVHYWDHRFGETAGVSGYGTYGYAGPYTAYYSRAACQWVNYPMVSQIACTTDWHD